MANFSVKASFDGSELVQGFKEVKTEINGLANAGKTAQKSLGEMLQKKNSTSDYRRQLSLLSREITDLTVNYRRMSEAEQQSEFGVALKQKIDELTAKASEFKDAMLDVQQSINESASDTANWDAFQSLVDITSSSLQTFVGVAGMSEDSVAALTRTIAIMQTTGAAANTVIKVGNALQKTSALMLGVARVQNAAAAAAIKIKTAAEGKSILATKAATVAQKAFNVVANMNPYVLLATAILGVGAALVGFVKKTSEAEKEQEAYNKTLEEQKEREERRREAISSSVGDVLSKYKLLQFEWNRLKTVEEKNEWIANNASAFNDLGLAIDGVTSAQKILVDNAPKVVTALRLQAEAAALTDLYKESYKKGYKRSLEIDKEIVATENRWQSGAEFTRDEFLKYNIGVGERLTTTVADSTPKWLLGLVTAEKVGPTATTEVLDNKVNSAGAKRIREHLVGGLEAQKEAAMAEANQIFEDLKIAQEAADEATKAVASAFNSSKGGTGTKRGNGGNSTQQKATLESETAKYIEAIKEQEDIYKNGVTSYEQYLNNKKQLTDKYINDIVNIEGDLTEPQIEQIKKAQQLSGSFNNLLQIEKKRIKLDQDKAKSLEDYAQTVVITQNLEEEGILSVKESREQQMAAAKKYYNFLISNWANLTAAEKEHAKAIKAALDAYDNPPKTKQEKYTEKQDKINDVLRDYDIGVIGHKEAKSKIAEINAEIEKLGLKPIQIHLNTERAMQAIDGLAAHFSVLTEIGNVVSSINSVYEAFKNLPNAMDEAENGWERFMVGFEAGMQVLNTIVSIMGAINTIMTTFNTIQEITTALKLKDAAASGVQAGADASAAGATMTKAGANMAEAATGAGKAVSWLPIVGPILAVAAIGAIMGVLLGVMSKSKFATGGIVPGSGIGDMDLVRVNGGEMILNGRQQKNLFNLIDHNRLSPSLGSTADVNFRIQGSTLVGVIENYNKRRSRG